MVRKQHVQLIMSNTHAQIVSVSGERLDKMKERVDHCATLLQSERRCTAGAGENNSQVIIGRHER